MTIDEARRGIQVVNVKGMIGTIYGVHPGKNPWPPYDPDSERDLLVVWLHNFKDLVQGHPRHFEIYHPMQLSLSFEEERMA